MSANMYAGKLIRADLAGDPAQVTVAEVTEVLFEGTSCYVKPNQAATWRELLIVRTSAGILLRDRVRESRDNKDRTISCDWQSFPTVLACACWLVDSNKLEARAKVRLIRLGK